MTASSVSCLRLPPPSSDTYILPSTPIYEINPDLRSRVESSGLCGTCISRGRQEAINNALTINVSNFFIAVHPGIQWLCRARGPGLAGSHPNLLPQGHPGLRPECQLHRRL